jgi:hypothetical protein
MRHLRERFAVSARVVARQAHPRRPQDNPLAYRGASRSHTSSVANIAALVHTALHIPGTRILNIGDPEPPSLAEILQRVKPSLQALAIGLLGVVPAFAAADEEAVAKNVEAFRAAQGRRRRQGMDGLCAAELSYSHSDARVEDKATFIANATDGKSKFLSLAYQDITIRVVGPTAIVRFHWMARWFIFLSKPIGSPASTIPAAQSSDP